MAKIDFKGIDEYAKVLETLGSESEEVVKSAVYKGAALNGDKNKTTLKGWPV